MSLTPPALYMFYVGGMVEGCQVELHDMRFAVGSSPEDCYGQLVDQWWGIPESFHLDAWGPVLHADGFNVAVTRGAPGPQRLWFVNLGGYDPAKFTELHHNALVVAPDARAAKQRALAQVEGWESPHKDFVANVETAVDLTAQLGQGGWGIILTQGPAKPFQFEARYVPVGKMAAKGQLPQ